MKRFLVPLLVILALYFDSIFFHQINIASVRPDTLLAVIISYSVLAGSVKGGVLGLISGLFSDIFFGEFIGFYALIYMLCAMAAGLFEGKFYSDNYIVAPLIALCASFLKDNISALVLSFGGGHFYYGNMLLTYILPCAVFTGLVCVLVHILLKPVMNRQVRQKVDRRIGG